MYKDSKQIIEKLLIPSYIPLYNKNFPLVIFWTPKSGCTTVNKWFFFQIGILNNANKDTIEVHRYRDFVYRKEPSYTQELTTILLKAQKDTYKIVRNPYKRAVSSFLHTICSPWLLVLFNSDINKGLSFKQFLYHLKNLGGAIHTIDRHIAPQYIYGEEHIIKNYIQLETFNNRITEIEHKYKLLKAPISQISKSSHHFSNKMIHSGNFAETTLTYKTLSGNFPTYDSFYDNETKNLVNEIFIRDFEVYNYNQKNIT